MARPRIDYCLWNLEFDWKPKIEKDDDMEKDDDFDWNFGKKNFFKKNYYIDEKLLFQHNNEKEKPVCAVKISHSIFTNSMLWEFKVYFLEQSSFLK